MKEVIKNEDFSKKPWLLFIPSVKKRTMLGQSVLIVYPIFISHPALLTKFFEGGNISNLKKISTFPELSGT